MKRRSSPVRTETYTVPLVQTGWGWGYGKTRWYEPGETVKLLDDLEESWGLAPEHLHWPEPVVDILGEKVGRYVCVDCYDTCRDALWIELDGELVATWFDFNTDQVFMRNRAGEITQLQKG